MIKQKTQTIRQKTAHTILKILTPKTLKFLDTFIIDINKTPRPFTKMLKTTGNKRLYGAEIGYGKGENLTSLLKELPIASIYSIDPYINQTYQEGNSTVNQYKNKANLTILNDPRVIQIPYLSSDAAKIFTAGKFDFVYIDGNHTYEQVKQDLELYTPLVRKGGYIGGHDYTPHQAGVIKAVQEHALKIQTAPTIEFPDFWFKVN